MSKYLISPGKLDALVDAYNALTGNTGQMTLDQLAAAIANIKSDTLYDVYNGIQTEYENDAWVRLPDYLFYNLRTLTKVSFPAATEIGASAFTGCAFLSEVDFPLVNTILGSSTFNSAGVLSYDLPELTTLVGSYVFAKNFSCTSFNAPKLQTLGVSANFSQCTSLQHFNAPLISQIPSMTFSNCSSLETASFPACQSIASSAFSGSGLASLTLARGGVAQLVNTNAFNNTPIAAGNGHIYVPASQVAAYKAATNWSTFASQIEAITE